MCIYIYCILYKVFFVIYIYNMYVIVYIYMYMHDMYVYHAHLNLIIHMPMNRMLTYQRISLYVSLYNIYDVLCFCFFAMPNCV